MGFKPSTKKKAAAPPPKPGDAPPNPRTLWRDLRAAIAKATGETLEAPEFTNRFETELGFLDVNLGWTPESKKGDFGLIGGRITLIHGKEGVLKSSILYYLGALAQARGGYFWLACPEESWNPDVADILNVDQDPDKFMHTCPVNLEEWLMSLDKFLGNQLIYGDAPIIIGLDTLAAITPKKETEETAMHSGLPMGTPGKLAQYLRSTKEIKRLTGRPVYIVILQQHRDSAGSTSSFGQAAEKVPGGRALRHWVSASIEMDLLTKTEADEKGIVLLKKQNWDKKFCDIVNFRFVKNRTEIGGRVCDIPYFFKQGFNDAIACFDYLFKNGYLTIRGNWIEIGETKMYRKDWYKQLITNPVLARSVRDMGKQAYWQENFTGDDNDMNPYNDL